MAAAFRNVYRAGFQGADLDTILASAGVTKGALYHHFADKRALGYALVDEVLARITEEKWLRPLAAAADPVEALIAIVEGTSLATENVTGGCPLNNLAQEMSPLDEGFRRRLARLFERWQDGVAAALQRGQKRGLVRADVDCGEAAALLVATYEGFLSLAKAARDPRVLRRGLAQIARQLEALRAPARRRSA